MNTVTVHILVLTTCPQCKALKDFLTEQQIVFTTTEVDLLATEERDDFLRSMAAHNPKKAFPVTFINGKAIIGFRKDLLIKELEQQQ